jgi:hypothetical protein
MKSASVEGNDVPRQQKSPDSDKHSALVHPAEAGVNDIQVRHGNL